MCLWQNELSRRKWKRFSPYSTSSLAFPKITIIKQFLMYPFRDFLGISKHIKIYIYNVYPFFPLPSAQM